MDHKGIIASIKAFFDAPVVPAADPTPAPAAPVAPAAPAALAGTVFKLKDGSEISIAIKDPAVTTAPSVGDMVSVGGAPAPEGVYELEDGTSITTDATGTITIIVEPAPATQPDFTAPPAQTLEERIKALEVKIAAPGAMAAIDNSGGLTTEMLNDMYAKFATGTPEERLTNIEIMLKALMECNFGYQIRQGQESEAIRIYKEGLTPVQNTMAAHELKIEKQNQVIAQLISYCEKFGEEPMVQPVTLTGSKKDSFDKHQARMKKLEEMGKSRREMKVLS